MEKNVRISILCELYGKMLTDRQYACLDDYYNNDLSLSEIAENNNITRQAVRDVIKQGENNLFELEENIGFMRKIQNQEKQIKNILEELDKTEKCILDENVKNDLKNIKNEIKKLI